MRKLAIAFALTVIGTTIPASESYAATLEGWVFRDVNGNGQRDATLLDTGQDTYERGIGGATVAAINAAGVSTAGAFVACTGRDTPIAGCVNILDSFYRITVANNAAYRIELSGIAGLANGVLRAGVQTPVAGAGQVGSNSAVQFVTVAAADIIAFRCWRQAHQRIPKSALLPCLSHRPLVQMVKPARLRLAFMMAAVM